MFLGYYPIGVCRHCVWVSQNKQVQRELHTEVTTIKKFLPNLEQEFIGMTVIDSHHIFRNAFNCVSGVENGLSAYVNHNIDTLGSLLIGVTYFIEWMNKTYHVQRMNVTINSKMDMVKYAGKEHPHALVVLADDEEQNNRVLHKIESEFYRYKPKISFQLKDVASEPFPEDKHVVDLSPEECKQLIRSGRNAMNFLGQKLGINPFIDNFYLFLHYSCPSGEPGCGIISGKVSIA